MSNNTAPSATIRPNARVEKLDQSQTTNQQLPIWVWIAFIVLLIVGWVTDTPATMIKQIARKKDA